MIDVGLRPNCGRPEVMPNLFMVKLIHRYRSYLSSKAVSRPPGAPRLIEMQWQWLPWLIPWAVAWLICWVFGLSGLGSLYVVLPLLGLSLVGACFVGWVILVDGAKHDVERWRSK